MIDEVVEVRAEVEETESRVLRREGELVVDGRPHALQARLIEAVPHDEVCGSGSGGGVVSVSVHQRGRGGVRKGLQARGALTALQVEQVALLVRHLGEIVHLERPCRGAARRWKAAPALRC